jgi:membrane fusion protein (multidrug efflux system)
MELQGSHQVAVVGPDQKVDIRPVKVGQQVDGLWVISEGLRPGDRVVVEGVQKLRPGMVVTATPYAPPAPAGSPTKAASLETPTAPAATPVQQVKR